MNTAPLTDRDREMLAFERTRWNFPGMREQAIRDQFGISATRYAQRLLALIDRPEALAALEGARRVEDRPAPSRRVVKRLLDHWDEMDEVGRHRELARLVARVDLVPVEGGRSLIRPLGAWEA
jgi:hypothetical protein